MKTKKTVLIILSALLFSGALLKVKAQTIPANFFGENAWMPDSVGRLPAAQFLPGGYLHQNWPNVKNLNVKLIRYGGAAANNTLTTNFQYLKMVDSIRNIGAEPVLQVPFKPTGSPTYDSSNARAIVKFINTTKGRNVKYWIIGNEPDLALSYEARRISLYIKQYAIAMKNQDPTIKIIGPELSYMSGDPGSSQYKMVDSLTDPLVATTGSLSSIMGYVPSGYGSATGKAYVDFFSYHMYNYDYSSTKSRNWCVQTMTAAPTATVYTRDTVNMGYIKRRLDAANSNTTLARGTQSMLPIITEANICTQGTTQPAADTYRGLMSSSFYAGQQWTEMMSWGIYQGIQSINFWSVMESNGMGCMTNATTPAIKSSYIHMKAMTQWFKPGDTLRVGADEDTTTSVDCPRLKSFAGKNGCYTVIMILNEDTISSGADSNKIYKINLNNSFSASTGYRYRIKYNMNLNKSYVDTIRSESTTILVFNCTGGIAQKYRYIRKDSTDDFIAYKPAASPATVYSVSIGGNQTLCCPGCTWTFTASINPVGGSPTYQWYKNGTAVSTATNSTYTVGGSASTTNTIQCVITTSTGHATPRCTTSASALLTVGNGPNCSGPQHRLADPNSQVIPSATSELRSLVPNPAENQVSVYYTLTGGSNQYELKIMNLSGQSVSNYRINPETEKLDIDCTNLSSGLYFTSLLENGNVISTKKLIITK